MVTRDYHRKFNIGSIERRYTHSVVATRAETSSRSVSRIVGYAAKFNVRSDSLGTPQLKFVEVIEPGFFDNVLLDDVRCLFNHDANLILGRNLTTLRLRQDRIGLWYECDAEEEISYARDLMLSLGRKDVTQSSFAFRLAPGGDRWVDNGDYAIRYLRKGGCARLFDVSPVAYPAYPSATSAISEVATDARDAAATAREHDYRRRRLDLQEQEC